MPGLSKRRLDLFSATAVVAVLAAGCQPEVLIATGEPQAGSGGAPIGGGGGRGAGTGGGGGAGGTVDVVPSAGDAGTSPVAEPPRLLADSVADFSLTQGELGWSYGYDLGTLDSFTPLNRKSFITAYVNASNDAWDCWANDTAHWTQIFALGAHPNGTDSSSPKNGILQRAVRRWTSPYAADVTIAGEIAKIDTGTLSNGIDAFVFVDGVQRYTTFIAGDDAGGRSYKVVASLHVGSTVDFVLDPHEGADHNDLSRFTGIIVRVQPGPAE
jgi:hypothetical protein